MSARAFLYRAGDRIQAVAPFNNDFKEDLKSEIPHHARTFDSELKNWLIDADYEEMVYEIATRYFDVIAVVSEADALRRERAARAAAPPPPREPSHSSDECLRRVRGLYAEESTLYTLPGAPFAVIQAAYRALAKILHPDAGGSSHQAMVALNRAYESLERRQKAPA